MVKKRRSRGPAAKPQSDVSSSDELNDARVNFEGALQVLSKPPKRDIESESSDDESQKKEASKGSAKNRPARNHQPFVMKLFDRSVDLAQFSQDTPLYPMCRAWMLNQPQFAYKIRHDPAETEQSDSETKDDDNDEEMTEGESSEEQLKDVYRLPPPIPHTDESRMAKVPQPVEHDSKYDISLNGAEPPSKHELLTDNLIRWNKVRKSWLQAAANNDKRYEKSFKIFTTIYEKTMQSRQF